MQIKAYVFADAGVGMQVNDALAAQGLTLPGGLQAQHQHTIGGHLRHGHSELNHFIAIGRTGNAARCRVAGVLRITGDIQIQTGLLQFAQAHTHRHAFPCLYVLAISRHQEAQFRRADLTVVRLQGHSRRRAGQAIKVDGAGDDAQRLGRIGGHRHTQTVRVDQTLAVGGITKGVASLAIDTRLNMVDAVAVVAAQDHLGDFTTRHKLAIQRRNNRQLRRRVVGQQIVAHLEVAVAFLPGQAKAHAQFRSKRCLCGWCAWQVFQTWVQIVEADQTGRAVETGGGVTAIQHADFGGVHQVQVTDNLEAQISWGALFHRRWQGAELAKGQVWRANLRIKAALAGVAAITGTQEQSEALILALNIEVELALLDGDPVGFPSLPAVCGNAVSEAQFVAGLHVIHGADLQGIAAAQFQLRGGVQRLALQQHLQRVLTRRQAVIGLVGAAVDAVQGQGVVTGSVASGVTHAHQSYLVEGVGLQQGIGTQAQLQAVALADYGAKATADVFARLGVSVVVLEHLRHAKAGHAQRLIGFQHQRLGSTQGGNQTYAWRGVINGGQPLAGDAVDTLATGFTHQSHLVLPARLAARSNEGQLVVAESEGHLVAGARDNSLAGREPVQTQAFR